MSKSKIEWTEQTWNPVTGCEKVSLGCKHCYAERLFSRVYPGRKFTDVQLHPERLEQPLKRRKSTMWFVNSMSDLFHEDVVDEFIAVVFGVAAATQHHTYQILTKRAERMPGWSEWLIERYYKGPRYIPGWCPPSVVQAIRAAPDVEWPLPNVWLGVSVENQQTADERIPLLLETPAAVRFLSVEPLLEPVELGAHLEAIKVFHDSGVSGSFGWADIGWVIVGGESGPKARDMDPDWARSIRDECQQAGVPFFMKQMARTALIPDDLMIREYPA